MTNRVELSVAERFVFADGHQFGSVGAYERLKGRAHFAVDRCRRKAGVLHGSRAAPVSTTKVPFRW